MILGNSASIVIINIFNKNIFTKFLLCFMCEPLIMKYLLSFNMKIHFLNIHVCHFHEQLTIYVFHMLVVLFRT